MCEIVGEIKKYRFDMDTPPDYFIKLSELGEDQFGLDSSRHSNVGRFVNHSCEPNLVLVRALIEEYRFKQEYRLNMSHSSIIDESSK